MDITKIDKNFAIEATVDKPDAVFYDANTKPFCIYGVQHDGNCYRRMPEAVAAKVSAKVHLLSSHTAGGRVRFCTDSQYVAIRALMPIIGKMGHFAFSGSAGFDLYADGVFVKTFVPKVKITDGFESVIDLGERKMRQIMIHFPLYSAVSSLEIGLQETAVVESPTPYRVETPVVFYGSSITQGGCASRPGNCYTAVLSRRLNFDHVNLGFSGSGKAEQEMADYIANLHMSVFVYDYDHNAPDLAHLQATHEKMFCTIREKNPTLPIVILSRPKFLLSDVEKQRMAVIRTTWEKAVAAGDTHVYFVEGPTLMATAENEGTVDGTHPNDLGFYSMANALESLISSILNQK